MMRFDALLLGSITLLAASAPAPASHAKPPTRKGTMSEKAGGTSPFDSVTYAIEGGFAMGGGDLHESETNLTIDLHTGAAALASYQPTFAEPGEPLGTFRAVLPAELVSLLQTGLARANLDAVVPGDQDGPGRSTIRIQTRRHGREHRFAMSTGDMTTLHKLDPFLSLFDKAIAVVAKHPYQAIRLYLQTRPGPDLAFTITVRNVGTEPVAIPDLATLRRESDEDSNEHGIGVRVAVSPTAPPGYTEPPLEWSRVEVVGAIDGPGKSIELPPGGERTFETAIVSGNKTTGRLLAQAFFSFYRRPNKGGHPHLIRGLARSEGAVLKR